MGSDEARRGSAAAPDPKATVAERTYTYSTGPAKGVRTLQGRPQGQGGPAERWPSGARARPPDRSMRTRWEGGWLREWPALRRTILLMSGMGRGFIAQEAGLAAPFRLRGP
uniref:Uncharacterized protein n=1 Tax=Eutreptiella gymnastica TaxID=73025 RepID=A0A7S1NDQ9_9EUGL